jgi:hypothetical protein
MGQIVHSLFYMLHVILFLLIDSSPWLSVALQLYVDLVSPFRM